MSIVFLEGVIDVARGGWRTAIVLDGPVIKIGLIIPCLGKNRLMSYVAGNAWRRKWAARNRSRASVGEEN